MKRVLALAALALWVALDAAAFEIRLPRQQKLRIDLTHSLFANYHLDPGNGDPTSADYGELLSRFNAQLAWWRLTFGARLDSAAYLDAPEPAPAGRFVQNPLYLEKIFLSYGSRSFDATLGDFYANFGRGLVLSIRKVDELGVDTTLRGAKLALHRGDFSAVALAGWTNIQNVDEARANYSPDPEDFLTGGHADYRAGGRVLIGTQAIIGFPSKNANALSKENDYYLRYGLSIDAPRLLPWLALYGEYAHGDDRITSTTRPSDAFYGAATAYFGPTVWLLELKDYRNYRPWHSSVDPFGSLVYMQLPTLERAQTQVTNNTDIVASRLRVDLRLADWLLLFLAPEYGVFHPEPGVSETLIDLYGGAQLRWNHGRSHFFPLGGYRLEQDDATGKLAKSLIAFEWDGMQMLGHRWSLDTQGLIWVREDALVGTGQWVEGNVYLAVKWVPHLILATGYEFTTDPREAAHQHDFPNGSLQWNITSSTSVRLFAGGQRPGLKCVSGVCRNFPAFQGVKLEVVIRL